MHGILIDSHKKSCWLGLCVHAVFDIEIVALLVSEVRNDTSAPRADECNTFCLWESKNLILENTLCVEILTPSRVRRKEWIVSPVTLDCYNTDEVVRNVVRRTNPLVRDVILTAEPLLCGNLIASQVLWLVNQQRNLVSTTVTEVDEVRLLEALTACGAETDGSNVHKVSVWRNPETWTVEESRVRSLAHERNDVTSLCVVDFLVNSICKVVNLTIDITWVSNYRVLWASIERKGCVVHLVWTVKRIVNLQEVKCENRSVLQHSLCVTVEEASFLFEFSINIAEQLLSLWLILQEHRSIKRTLTVEAYKESKRGHLCFGALWLIYLDGIDTSRLNRWQVDWNFAHCNIKYNFRFLLFIAKQNQKKEISETLHSEKPPNSRNCRCITIYLFQFKITIIEKRAPFVSRVQQKRATNLIQTDCSKK